MKSNNYPSTTSSFSEDERAKFHLSLELDFDLNALIAKIKYLASLSSSTDDLQRLQSLLHHLHVSIDNYKNDISNETED